MRKTRSRRLATYVGIGVASGCLTAPAMAKPHLSPYAGAEVTLTDNLDLTPRGRTQSGAVLTEFIGAQLREANRHTNYALDATLNLDTTLGNGTDFGVRPDVLGTGRIELVEGHVYVDGRILSRRELISSQGRVGSTPTVGRNEQANATTVQVSPYLQGHIGPYADTELRYTNQANFVESEGTGNSMTNTVSWRTTSGRALPRVRLTALAEYSDTRATTKEDNLERKTGIVSAEYALTRQVFLLGSAGYETFDSPTLTRDRNGPIWTVGLRYRPSPRAEIEFNVGRRYGGATYNGQASYKISSRWTASASYGESLESPQTRIGRPASRLTLDPATGEFIVTDPRDLGIQRSAAIVGTLRADLVGRYTVDDFRLAFTRETRRYDIGADETILSTTAQWNRRLSERLTFGARAQYRRNTSEGTGGDSQTVIGGVNLNYTVYRNVNATVSLSRSQRFSSDPNDRYTENTILIGFLARF